MSRSARALRHLVRAYQRVFAGRVSPCRFVPSCSSYALEALEGHGALSGGWLSARRLCRCHPWGGHGWDPVPEPRPAGRSGSSVAVVGAGRSGSSTEQMEHRCPI